MSDIKSTIQKYLNPVLGIPKKSYNFLKYNCPSCDSGGKHNLEIHTEKKIFNCWSCHYSGRIQKLLKDYSIDSSWKVLKEFEYGSYKKGMSREELRGNPVVLFPANTVPFYMNEKTRDYLLNERKMDIKVLTARNVRYCFHPNDPYYNCILFPFYDDDKNIIAFCSQNMETKKYRNTGALNFIAYKNHIDSYFPIVITEGIYDALSVPNAIPLLGTRINHELYRFCKDKKIILALDNNEEVSIDFKKQIVKKFYVYGAAAVMIFELGEYKDLNEFWCKDMPELKQKTRVMFELLNNF